MWNEPSAPEEQRLPFWMQKAERRPSAVPGRPAWLGRAGPAAGSLISPACFPSRASFPFFHGAVPVGLVPGMGY